MNGLPVTNGDDDEQDSDADRNRHDVAEGVSRVREGRRHREYEQNFFRRIRCRRERIGREDSQRGLLSQALVRRMFRSDGTAHQKAFQCCRHNCSL